MIDWLMVFYAQAATYHLYSGDEHEIDEKKKWIWNDEMKNGMGHKANRVNEFRLPLEKGRGV